MPRGKYVRSPWIEFIADYCQLHGTVEYEIDEVVAWAIERDKWQAPPPNIHKIARQECKSAIKAYADEHGIEFMICVQREQRHFWADRRKVDRLFRQHHLDQEVERVGDHRQKLISKFEIMLAEQSDSEEPLQLTFAWEDEHSVT